MSETRGVLVSHYGDQSVREYGVGNVSNSVLKSKKMKMDRSPESDAGKRLLGILRRGFSVLRCGLELFVRVVV